MREMAAQAKLTYPEECCGLLLGTQNLKQDRRWVHELLPMENKWTAEVQALTETETPSGELDKRTRYWIDPKALMKAQRYGRDRGWIILGIYHSHPDHPAVPSERDRYLAWSEYSYPILSVVNGQVVDVRSWRLKEDSRFHSEAIASAP
ncbi:MAG: M67 family metallopeptidase [Leptolyngbya sp. SIO1D8]|nr:M67 family metallopeptidase [Leptolyngbya sp. SIO1D8]